MAVGEKDAAGDQNLLEVMSLKPNDDERTTISKKLSWILRHGAKRVEIDISKDGWVKMSDLKKAEFMADIPDDKIKAVIEESNKQKMRYELSKDGQSIRAVSKVPGVEKVVKTSSKGSSGKGGKKGKGGNESGNRKNKQNGGDSKGKSVVPTVAAEPPPAPPLAIATETRMRQDAPPFVPSPNAAAAQMSAAMMMPPMSYPAAPFGFPYPLGYGLPMGYGLPGYGVPQILAKQAAVNQQFRGWIKSFNDEKGFGFIECPEAHQLFGRDVFLHKAHKGELAVGAHVTFTVETNKRDMPQAKDLQAIAGKGGKPGKGKGKGTKAKGKGQKKKKEGEEGEDAEKKEGEESQKDQDGDGDAKVEDAKNEETQKEEQKDEKAS